MSLTGVVICEPKCPAFMNVGLLDYIVELIICEDEVSDSNFTVQILISYSHIYRPSA